MAALFNHSCCQANVKVRKVVANNTDARFPIHGFFALKKIVVREVRTYVVVGAVAAVCSGRPSCRCCLCCSCVWRLALIMLLLLLLLVWFSSKWNPNLANPE